MRNNISKIKLVASLVLVLALTFSTVSCGEDDLDSLAKRNVELVRALQNGANPADPKIRKEVDYLNKKIDGMSAYDKGIYQDKFLKLLTSQ